MCLSLLSFLLLFSLIFRGTGRGAFMACLSYIELPERRKTLSNQPTNQRKIERDSVKLYLTGQVP